MDLDVRIKEHNDPENSKHTYTKRFGLGWQLIYSEICQTRKQALIREKQLKSYQGRQFIKTHIPLVCSSPPAGGGRAPTK